MINGKKIIAFCLSKIHDRDSNALISSLSEALYEMDCRLFVYSTCSDLYWGHPSEKGEASIFGLMDYSIIDAVILFNEKLVDSGVKESIVLKANMHGVPVINIGNASENGIRISVRFDYEAGFENLARHVIEEHKARNIHFMAGFQGNEFSEKRFKALKKVMHEHGLETPDDMVSYGDFWSYPAQKAAEALISRKNIPDAVICANDTMAIAVCEVFRQHGYKIPDDIIITGMDGIDEIYFSTPQITSCECRFGDISKKIASILPDIFSGKLKSGDFPVIPSLILSQSCGCSNGKDIKVSEYLNLLNGRIYKFQNDEYVFSRASIKMQTSETIEKAALELRAAICANMDVACPMCCLLTENCIDEKMDLLSDKSEYGFGERLCLFYDHDRAFRSGESFTPQLFDRTDIIPDLYEKLEGKYPLIFVAMNFLDKPLGYSCFYFSEYDISSYARIPQVIDLLNIAISGFINIQHQRYLNSQIEKIYESDALTKLYNRNGFHKKYKALMDSLRDGDQISVILADLDGLKAINDNYGHDEGDNAIFTVAKAIQNVFPEDAICARFGGDELIAVTVGESDENAVKIKFERFFDNYNKTSGKPYRITASIGICTAGKSSGFDFETLFKEADKKMYKDKLQRKAAQKEWLATMAKKS